MISTDQNLIRTGELAKELRVDADTLCEWARKDPRIKAAKFKRGWFSVQKLRDIGVLVTPSTNP